MKIESGKLIVFEGMDKAGKSTQIDHLKSIAWHGERPNFVHMPTGLSVMSQGVAQLLENSEEAERVISPLGRQLFHLGCHADSMKSLNSALKSSAVFLDRFWWSTFAYGWCGADISKSSLKEDSFMNLVRTVWKDIKPDVIFVFLHPRSDDSNNNPSVEKGYRTLVEQNPAISVLVPNLKVDETTEFIVSEMVRRGLLM